MKFIIYKDITYTYTHNIKIISKKYMSYPFAIQNAVNTIYNIYVMYKDKWIRKKN